MLFASVYLLFVAVFTLSSLIRAEPKLEDARAAGLNDFNFPTTTEGRVWPLGWGTDKFDGPNVLWYGDLRTVAIREKVKVSPFNSKRVTVGHKYYVGFQMGICHGPCTLHKIWVGDKLVWAGEQSTDGDIEIISETTVKLILGIEYTFGDKDLNGTVGFYTGSKTQAIDPYLATHQTSPAAPAYRGLCYVVFKGGYVGKQPTLEPWSFEISRQPTGLGSAGNGAVNIHDTNPMEMAYELFTSTDFGYGFPDADINLTEFRGAGQTLLDEGNGISRTLQKQQGIPETLKEIEKQADCRFRLDPATGQWRVVLVRDGYSLPGLRTADKTNIKQIMNFSRQSWEETINSVRIAYKRRVNSYNTSYAPATDGANIRIQNQVVPETWTYEGVKDDTLANKIAWRELRSSSYPLAKGQFEMDRSFWDAFVGEVFLLNYTIQDEIITDMPMRITRIDIGNKADPKIMVDAVQDIFSWRAASFADQDQTSWDPPDRNVFPFTSADQIGFEAPYAISRRDISPSEGRVLVSGAEGNFETAGFAIKQRNGTPPVGSYLDAGSGDSFMFTGALDTAIDIEDTTIDVLTDMDILTILAASDSDVGNELTNLFLIDDEFMACTGVSAITGGLRLTGCYRGLLDSAQAEHADEAVVYFLSAGTELTATVFNTGNTVELKLLPYDLEGNQVSESDPGLTVLSVGMVVRERRPYPPTFMDLNGFQYPVTDVTLDPQQGSNEDEKGIEVEFNRRDYRILDEVSQNHTDAESLDATFPAANTTEYALEVWNDPDGTPALLYTTDWQSTATDYAYRTRVLRYMGGQTPARMRIVIKTRHIVDAVTYEATQQLSFDFDSISPQLNGDQNMGVLSDLETSTSWTAPDTGTYTFSLGHANTGGDIEAQLNGGGWAAIIATGNLTGDLVGVTAADTIEIRANGLSATVDETILRIDSPVSDQDGFAIFVP